MTLTLGRLLFSVNLAPARSISLDDAPSRPESSLERSYREDRRLADVNEQRQRWYIDMPVHTGRPF
jgi:hypothetical protein